MSATETATRSTAETAQAYFKAIEERDVEQMAAQWKPGSTDYFYGMAELRVPEDLKQWFGALFAAFPDFKMVVTDLISEGEQAAVRWHATGTFTGSGKFEGMIANGTAVEIEGLDLLTIRDGLVVENHAYTNGMDLARKLGAMPPQGSAGEKAMLGAFNLKTRVASRFKRA
ncbi:MAG: ester cyclase [Solirubrobacterales bacterium]